MKQFEERNFSIPELRGISARTIEEHLKLYTGYVKNVNTLYGQDYKKQSFEFCGMRNHEYYFAHFEGGPRELTSGGALEAKIIEEWESIDKFMEMFKSLAVTTRGVGWAMLGYDKKTDRLLSYWVDEQHLGHFTGVLPVLALDMWEHSYVADYQPSGKKQYVEDFLANLNWQTCEQNLEDAYGGER